MERNSTSDVNRGYIAPIAPQAPQPGMGYTPPPPPIQRAPQPITQPPIKK
jgi:hypothetical protein